MDNENSLLSRLEKLEKENRWMKRAGLGVLLAAGALLVMGQARPVHKLEGQELVLRDAAGRMRAILSVSPEPHLTLYDTKGKMQADMSATANGGFLSLLDASASRSVAVGAATKDDVGLAISDEKQEMAAGMSVTNHGVSVELIEGPAKLMMKTSSGTALEGKPIINLIDRNGRFAALHPAGVILSDRNQKARLTLSSDLEEGPTLRLFDAQENPRVQLQAGKEGSSLRLKDSEGFLALLGSAESQVHLTGEKRIKSAASLLLLDKEGKVIWSAP